MTDLQEQRNKNILEAVLLVAAKPLSLERLQSLFDETERPSIQQLLQLLTRLQQDYVTRGIELKKLASGYCFQTRLDYAPWITRLFEEKPPRYSRALLEILAIIAYRQPITRGEIEEIRGVAVSSYIIKTLQDRNWIRIAGYRDVPGKPGIYATTKDFLDYFNLASLEALPSIQEIKASNVHEDNENLSVALESLIQNPVATVDEESIA